MVLTFQCSLPRDRQLLPVQLLTILQRLVPGRMARQHQLHCQVRKSCKVAPRLPPCERSEMRLGALSRLKTSGSTSVAQAVARLTRHNSVRSDLIPCRMCMLWLRPLRLMERLANGPLVGCAPIANCHSNGLSPGRTPPLQRPLTVHPVDQTCLKSRCAKLLALAGS